jgi:hypothetical protein
MGASGLPQAEEASECKDAPCAIEPKAMNQEQPHGAEDVPADASVQVRFVEIPVSPPWTAIKGSAEHLAWEAQTGEKAVEITDPEELKWLRDWTPE